MKYDDTFRRALVRILSLTHPLATAAKTPPP